MMSKHSGLERNSPGTFISNNESLLYGAVHFAKYDLNCANDVLPLFSVPLGLRCSLAVPRVLSAIFPSGLIVYSCVVTVYI